MSRSSAHRTLQELAGEGLLRSDESGQYSMAPALALLAARIVGTIDLRGAARRHLEVARNESGETVILTIYDRDRRQFAAIMAVETSNPVRYFWETLRDWNDLHLGASGRGILAFLPREEQEAVLDTLPDPVEGPKPVSKRALRKELDLFRDRGWASSHGGRYPGARGVCAPVRNWEGQIVGAVVIGWPDRPYEVDQVDAIGEVCRAASEAISQELGWSGHLDKAE